MVTDGYKLYVIIVNKNIVAGNASIQLEQNHWCIQALSRTHIRRFCRAITLSADKSLLADPISSLSAAKIGVGEESGMSDFFRRYGRPTVKLPSVMLEATLSGDIYRPTIYLCSNIILYINKNA